MTDTILYVRTGHVGRIVLNNPQRHNALGLAQLEAIQSYLTQVAMDRDVRVLILTGAGDKTFCAGASLLELSDGRIGDDVFQRMTGQFAALTVPTICALNGNVFGGGVELAASCDIRIGVKGSRMRVPAAELGLCYPLSGINRIVECMGASIAKRILLSAEEIDANGMLQIGFLDHLVAFQDLAGFVQSYAQRIADLAPLAVQAMKRILQGIISGKADPILAEELSTLCLESNDLREGLAARRDRRRPRFEGR